jgi:hypothetical protein
MTQLIPAETIAQLQTCLELATDVTRHAEANQAFVAIHSRLADEHPLAADLLERMWKEVIAARRSAAFWEQISDAERSMSEKMVENHTNLKQNYFRLIQEQ